MKEERQIYKTLPQIFLFFAPRLSYDLSKFSNTLSRFSTLKDHNWVPEQKLRQDPLEAILVIFGRKA